MCYAITSFGALVATSSSFRDAAVVQRLPAVQQFLKSGLQEGLAWQHTSDFLDGVLTSYRELPNTNLVVFAESSFVDLLMPLARLVATGLLVTLLSVMFLLFVLRGRLTTLMRPLNILLENFQRISRGEYNVGYAPRVCTEFDVLFRRLALTGHLLGERESSILRLQDNLEHVLALSHTLSHADTTQEVVEISSQILGKTLSPKAPWKAEFRLRLHKDTGPDFFNFAFFDVEGQSKDVTVKRKDLASSEEGNQNPDLSTLQADFPRQAPHKLTDYAVLSLVGESQGSACVYLRFQSDFPVACTPVLNHFLEVYMNSVASAVTVAAVKMLQKKKAEVDLQLKAAEMVQNHFLPKFSKKIGRFEWDAWLKSAEKVGGDLYTVRIFGAQKWALLFVGDATGHGIESAMLTSITFGVFAGFEAKLDISESHREGWAQSVLADLGSLLNETLLSAAERGVMMTGVMILVNLKRSHKPKFAFFVDRP